MFVDLRQLFSKIAFCSRVGGRKKNFSMQTGEIVETTSGSHVGDVSKQGLGWFWECVGGKIYAATALVVSADLEANAFECMLVV